MVLYVLLVAVLALGAASFLLAGRKTEGGYSWLQFFARGKDAGFSLREIELLRKVAVKAELKEPTALFWSVKQLDLCIRELIRKSRLTGQEDEPSTQDFLSKLYAYRKKIEFDQPRYKKGIKGSRQIGETQVLRILVDGAGVFKATVLRNSDRFLSISRPTGPRLPPSFTWKGRRVAVYFWRKDDAGYVFDTYVLDDVQMRANSALQLAHSDSLFRTQKRKSIRAKTRISAYLYIPRGEEPPEKAEPAPGLRCILEDLSEDGYAVTIGGRATAGLRVKAQFELEGEPVVMLGTVKSSDYDEETNRSVLHVEADPLSLPTRNRILAQVFDVQPDADAREAFSIFDANGEVEEEPAPPEPPASVPEGLPETEFEAFPPFGPSAPRADAVPKDGGTP